MSAALFCLVWIFVFGLGFGFGYFIGNLAGTHREALHTATLLDSIQSCRLRPGAREELFLGLKGKVRA
ncbi:MAG: hypothetical protein ACXWP5_00385 [Bdellovibrionota bacterium]